MSTNEIYHIEVLFDEKEKGYVAKIPALNNIAAFGQTKEEAVRNVKKVQTDYLKFLEANSKPIPKSDKN